MITGHNQVNADVTCTGRLLVKFLTVLALLLLPLLPARAQTTITWSRPMLDQLGAIADTATVEHVRCLLGAVYGDTVYVLVAWAPRMAIQTPVTAAPAEPCPPLITLAEWHNHIPREFTLMGEARTAHPQWAYCYLSPIDRRRERDPDAAPLQVLHVTKDVSCAWILVDGRYVPLKNWPPLPR